MAGKLLAVTIGFAFLLVGLGIARFGRPVIIALNRDYARLPGRMQYPLWFHRFFGAIVIGFGVLVAVVGLITVKGDARRLGAAGWAADRMTAPTRGAG